MRGLCLLLVLAGCSTIREARDAQRDFEPKGRDGVLSSFAARTNAIPPSYRLSTSLALALTNRPSLVAARLAVEDARLNLKQLAADAPIVSETPWTAFDVSLSASESQASRGQQISDFNGHTRGDPSAALSVDVLVYDFGRNAADRRAQAERVVAAEQTLVQEGYTVFQECANAYFACREKKALLAAAEASERALALRLSQAEGRLREGETRNLDVLNARVELAKARETLLAASNDVLTAAVEWRHALGVPPAEDAPGADFATEFADETLVFKAADPLALVLTNAPAMRIARARVRAAQADVDRAVADLYPSVSASASLTWTDPLWYLSFGGKVVQSIFQGFRKTTAVDRAVVALKSAASDADAAEQDLARSVALALATRQNAYETERAAKKTLAAAEENLTVVTREVELGEADRIDLNDAISSVATARGSLATAGCTARKAEAELFALAGALPVFALPETK